jgi:hypothetical protein
VALEERARKRGDDKHRDAPEDQQQEMANLLPPHRAYGMRCRNMSDGNSTTTFRSRLIKWMITGTATAGRQRNECEKFTSPHRLNRGARPGN